MKFMTIIKKSKQITKLFSKRRETELLKTTLPFFPGLQKTFSAGRSFVLIEFYENWKNVAVFSF